jgi:hypothetical protein
MLYTTTDQDHFVQALWCSNQQQIKSLKGQRNPSDLSLYSSTRVLKLTTNLSSEDQDSFSDLDFLRMVPQPVNCECIAY